MKQNQFEDQSDSLIWHRFKEGDREALTFVYLHYHKHLINYGIRLCKDQELVEDCIQDLFVELWKGRKGLSPTNSIRYYLLKVLRNKIHTRLKLIHPTADVDLYADDYHFQVEYSFEEHLIRQLGDEQLQGKLLAALNALPARQKEIVYLRFYNNFDYGQIASIMGITYQTARTHVYQAIKSLRERFAIEGCILALLLSIF